MNSPRLNPPIAPTIDQATTMLATACTTRERLVAAFALERAAHEEGRRLRAQLYAEAPPHPTAGSATHWTESWAAWRAQIEPGQDPLGRTWIDPRKEPARDPHRDVAVLPSRYQAIELQEAAAFYYKSARQLALLGAGEFDPDFVRYDQRRAADYARKARELMGVVG